MTGETTAMMVTMGVAFAVYLVLLEPMTDKWGIHGLWGAVLIFMAARGLAQALEAECRDLLDEAYERGLVQFGENVQQRVNFICNCCGCCCEAMIAARRFGHLHPVQTTSFMPEIATENCTLSPVIWKSYFW